MKRTLTLFTITAICCAMMVSCKNKQSEPTPEEIEAQKVALADSILAKIDDYAEQYIKAGDDGCILANISLTDEEKLVKPSYLLDPGEVSNFITKEQKINALAIFYMEYFFRLLYNLPTDEVKEVSAKLAFEVNHPIDSDIMTSSKPVSEVIREQYKACRDRGDLAYFWQFQIAILIEFDYLLANNPELLLNRVSEDCFQAYNQQWVNVRKSIEYLSQYDCEIEQINNNIPSSNNGVSAEDAINIYYPTVAKAIETYKEYKSYHIDKRNALLQ